MSEDLPFDRRLRRLRRDRAAAAPDGSSDRFLWREMTDELLDRLAFVRRPFARALAIGGGTGLVERLRASGLAALAVDPGHRFAAAAGGLQGDEDHLPVADGALDLAVAAGTLDGVNDLPGALLLIRRALRPDGLFLGAFVGAGSLPRLRAALAEAEALAGGGAAPRLHPQIDARSAGDLLQRAGFALPVADTVRIEVRYRSLFRLVADLRAMGASNILARRDKRQLPRAAIAHAAAAFAASGEPERFELIFLSGWAPSPDQPKPAARGSATHSLADALRPRG